MEFIVAVDKNWAIGKNGGMLYHLPEDLRFFKETTMGHVLLMGRKTFESLPGGALSHRVNVVLTTNLNYQAPDAQVIHHLDELDAVMAGHPDKKLFLIGGGRLYHDLLDRCESGYVTKVDAVTTNADTYFPNLDVQDDFAPPAIIKKGVSNGFAYTICRYHRHRKG